MTEAEIIKSNVLIAEFMGYEKGADIDSPEFEIPDHPIEVHWMGNLCGYERDELRFHTLWEWLMPVVEKIESIKDPHDGFYGVYISSNSCCIQGTSLHMALSDPDYGPVYYDEVVLGSKLESTYQAVIQFIKWFNSKQQSENGRGHNH
jgi:hypothetical protein